MNLDLHRGLLQQAAETENIPAHMREGLIEFICTGRPTGDFLAAVLSNDLKEACRYADDFNKHRLFDYVTFLYNHAPVAAWGSPKKMHEWTARRGLEGVLAKAEKQA